MAAHETKIYNPTKSLQSLMENTVEFFNCNLINLAQNSKHAVALRQQKESQKLQNSTTSVRDSLEFPLTCWYRTSTPAGVFFKPSKRRGKMIRIERHSTTESNPKASTFPPPGPRTLQLQSLAPFLHPLAILPSIKALPVVFACTAAPKALTFFPTFPWRLLPCPV